MYDNINVLVCRWCTNRIALTEEFSREREERMKLQDRVDILQAQLESLLSGPGSPSSSHVENRPSVVQSATNDNSSNSRESSVPFQEVQRGGRPARVKEFLPIKTTNKFSVLGFEDDSEPDTILVGDSLCRGQLEEFCGRNHRRRRRFCCPGAKVEDITNSVDSFTEGIGENSRIIVQVGTNNVLSSRSEELLEKYRQLIQRLKSKTNNILFTGILPRINAREDFYGKAHSTSNRLGSLSAGKHWICGLLE